MVDVGLTLVIVKWLNRWYFRRSQPHGVLDHTFRGIRMQYNNSYRAVVCVMSLLMLSIAAALFFIPNLFADKSPWLVLILKVFWAGLLVVVLLAPIQAFREFVIVGDEGLLKSNLFGCQTRFEWKEISRLQLKVDENEIVFLTQAKSKLKMSFCYNGWRDFLEMSAKHLDPILQGQLAYHFARLAEEAKPRPRPNTA